MAKYKQPPLIKIYEAFSVMADQRYQLSKKSAIIHSSDHAKSYLLEWQDVYPLHMTANDNGTYYKGYIGYTMIAMLMALGKIRYDHAIAAKFSSVNWKQLNTVYNNDYDLVITLLLKEMSETEITDIKRSVNDIAGQLKNIDLRKLARRRKPPK